MYKTMIKAHIVNYYIRIKKKNIRRHKSKAQEIPTDPSKNTTKESSISNKRVVLLTYWTSLNSKFSSKIKAVWKYQIDYKSVHAFITYKQHMSKNELQKMKSLVHGCYGNCEISIHIGALFIFLKILNIFLKQPNLWPTNFFCLCRIH